MFLLVRADQSQKQNHKDAILPAHPQELHLLEKELGPILNYKNIRSPIIECQRNWSIFFVMVIDFEKMMDRLNSWEKKIIFRINLCIHQTNDDKSERAAWQEEEEVIKDFSISPDSSGEIMCLRVLQGHSRRNHHYKTMSVFRTLSSSTIYHVGCAINLHSIINSGLIPVGQNSSTMDKEHKDPETIDLRAPRLA